MEHRIDCWVERGCGGCQGIKRRRAERECEYVWIISRRYRIIINLLLDTIHLAHEIAALRGFSITSYVSVNCDMRSRAIILIICTRVYRAYDRSRVCACIRNDPIRAEKFSFSASRVTLPRRIAEMPLLRLPGYTEAAGLFNKRRQYPRSYARYINERSSADSTESRWFLVSERRLRGLSRGRQQSRCVLSLLSRLR